MHCTKLEDGQNMLILQWLDQGLMIFIFIGQIFRPVRKLGLVNPNSKSLEVVNDFSSANFGQRRQKINHSYIGNNPVQSTTTGSRTATPGSKRPISVIFLTPEKEGRRGSLANVKALSAAERAKIEGKDSIILNLSGGERFLIDFYSIYELNDSIIYAEIQ